MSHSRVAVKEPNLNDHDMDIEQIIRYLNYGNLILIPYKSNPNEPWCLCLATTIYIYTLYTFVYIHVQISDP